MGRTGRCVISHCLSLHSALCSEVYWGPRCRQRIELLVEFWDGRQTNSSATAPAAAENLASVPSDSGSQRQVLVYGCPACTPCLHGDWPSCTSVLVLQVLVRMPAEACGLTTAWFRHRLGKSNRVLQTRNSSIPVQAPNT